MYRSSGLVSWLGSNVTGAVCLTMDSDSMCDGAADCLEAEDELARYCSRRGRALKIESDEDGDAVNDDSLLIIGLVVALSLTTLILTAVSAIVYKLKLKRTVPSNFVHLEYSKRSRSEEKESIDVYVLPREKRDHVISENTKDYCKDDKIPSAIVKDTQYINVNEYVPMSSFKKL